jgi:hypothetical protein
VFVCELLEIGTSGHRAVVVQNLDDDRGRRQAGEAREITAGFGVTGTAQHPARLRHQRKDMTRLTQVLRARVEAHCRPDGMRAVVGGDTRGHALRCLD